MSFLRVSLTTYIYYSLCNLLDQTLDYHYFETISIQCYIG
jgi:hypothetical protein